MWRIEEMLMQTSRHVILSHHVEVVPLTMWSVASRKSSATATSTPWSMTRAAAYTPSLINQLLDGKPVLGGYRGGEG